EGERPFQQKPTVAFRLISSRKAIDLATAAKEGKTPMTEIVCPERGSYWVALERAPVTITLAADKFNRYLEEEGLKPILEERRKSKEAGQPGRERYSRYLKCLLQAGGTGDETWKKVIGHRLEIVPLADPYAAGPGGVLKVRLLFEGKSLPNAALFAFHKIGDKVTEQRLTTAADGTAAVRLTDRGTWMLRLVHMRRCAGRADADWESFWTSLTFELR
ncbi:MAG TPA: DUF4198 domain-containing protein, partial [Gemmataceae bacterium]|nr:DUF4198 domain-containing protein [Gemmataceae bacterium]